MQLQTSPPDDDEDCDYNIILNKDKIQLGVGNADTIEITAKLKDGISTIASVEMVKDNWSVEWKIEDETIVKQDKDMKKFFRVCYPLIY